MLLRYTAFSLSLSLSLTLAACAEFPDLDRAITPQGRAAPPPDLAPLDQLLDARLAPSEGLQRIRDAGVALEARAGRTRAAAGALAKTSVQTDEARAAAELRRAALIRARAAAAAATEAGQN